MLSAIPNAAILLSPLITQEAVLSSRIEGTVATIGEVLEVDAGGDPVGMTPERRADAFEILNYRRAMRFCESELQNRTISQHMLRQAHEMLMQGVRGVDKNPGAYRTHQNWIGPPNCLIEDATFIPIAQDHLLSGLDKWEKFVASTDVLDPLVHLALIHAEFEALHPFMDGNGRLGRMVIPLFLHSKGLLSGPHFYMSAYMDANRDEYLDRLRAVSSHDDWTGWTLFFLEGLRVQAKDNEAKAREILNLYAEVKEKAINLARSQHTIRAVDFLFQRPIFFGPQFNDDAGIPGPTASRILGLFRDNGLIKTVTPAAGRRPGLYVFADLVNVVEGRRTF